MDPRTNAPAWAQVRFVWGTAILATTILAIGCRTLGSNSDDTAQAETVPIRRLPAGESEPTAAVTNPTKTRVDLLLAMAANQERHRQLSAAIASYERILELAPDHATATHRLALLHDRQGNQQQAEEYFAACQRLTPDDPNLLADLGYRAYLREDWPVAEQYFQRGLELAPKNARLHNNCGLLLARLERYPEALEEFRAGGCNRAQAAANVGHLCVIEQRWDQAHEYLLMATKDEQPSQSAQQTLRVLWPDGYDPQATPPREALVAFETQSHAR
jgi:Flp pilus assembly protein TadD